MTAEKEPIQPIDPVAFALAFVGAPLVGALLISAPGILGLLLPPFLIFPAFGFGGVVVGGPFYVLLGLPALLIGMHSAHVTSDTVLRWVLQALGLLALGIAAAQFFIDDGLGLFVILVFGLIYGPIWGLCFANLYRRLARPV